MYNQNEIINLKDTWLCLNCEETIIPKANSGAVIEGIIFFIGIGFMIFVNWLVGGFLIALSVVLILAVNRKKACPSCASKNIVPSDSPAALKKMQA